MDILRKDAFHWCRQCAYYPACYKEGFPHYLEPACGEGPAVSHEELYNDEIGAF